MSQMKSIAVLGSTGSIGKNTLNVARHLKDSLCVKALAVNSNIELLEAQIAEFHPEIVCVVDEKKALELKKKVSGVKIVSGEEGLKEVGSYHTVDFVVVAVVGLKALAPTVAAIEAGKGIGLANKEILVAAGAYISQLAKKHKVPLIPIDSEHSAIFQCLQNHPMEEVGRVILTASGGPFRSFSVEQLESVTLKQALNHPTWVMGPKITVDSSTLMNKGLEVIEAHFLFGIPVEKLAVVIHPQSIVHSFVEFIDGCILAEMSEPHMIFPIQYALTYPQRKQGLFAPFDFLKNSLWEFQQADFKKFPALEFAFEAVKRGKSMPCYLNAANEVLVEQFLQERISWREITRRLEKLLSRHNESPCDSLEAIYSVDSTARKEALGE
jgi:1-deoxy-D-xylulose-5-phosphate reductoisomerase